MKAIRFCPFCGCDNLTYYDVEYPIYGFCPNCKEWIAGANGFEEREVGYIIQKLKMIPRIAKNMEKRDEILQDDSDNAH